MNLSECYQLLELDERATLAQVKSSYRRLARRYHPDINPGDRAAHEKFIRLNQAYQQLVRVLPTFRSTSVEPEVNVDAPPAPPPPPDLSNLDLQLKQVTYRQLQELLKYRCYTRAISLIEGLVERLPQDPEIRQWQAVTYQCWAKQLIRDRQFDDARDFLNQALRADPENRNLWVETEKDFRTIDRLAGKSRKLW
ncbi:J domain-containing protein [Candidatus Synechococcus calcipolaris G9]|uniref:J domain-containing protein n=1 Tax=Candidatus Synechococcus calcipolaris G9 TaxID=1497997 RepID=A0ABT6F1S2_9SYNE|nr:J domain-containing protein [Candidatus Synechococcus calcipolaris]MDG2991760.1 J domain-containing protein [Candidatus Synechococcus calcipolaris G9]